MSNLLAGLIGALIGLSGVVAGAWLQGRREQQRWLRDHKLRASIDFIGATGDLYDHRRHPSAEADSADERVTWARAQDGRSALSLLCEDATVKAAEALITQIKRTVPGSDHNDEAITLLRGLVRRLRRELGAGTG